VAFALSECGFHHLQTLIERKPGRDGMPGQHIVLFAVGSRQNLNVVCRLISVCIPPPTDNPALLKWC
jgi:hypothetical protein